MLVNNQNNPNDAKQYRRTSLDVIAEEEDLVRKEEELKAELNLSTWRCHELSKSLQQTKSFVSGRQSIENSPMKPSLALNPRQMNSPIGLQRDGVTPIDVLPDIDDDNLIEEENSDTYSASEVRLYLSIDQSMILIALG
jgi:hypothetical protein